MAKKGILTVPKTTDIGEKLGPPALRHDFVGNRYCFVGKTLEIRLLCSDLETAFQFSSIPMREAEFFTDIDPL